MRGKELWEGRICGFTHTDTPRAALLHTVDRMIREIRHDAKLIPAMCGVKDFSGLHDHVDANEYGGACERPFPPMSDSGDAAYCEAMVSFWNHAQGMVCDWIQNGGLRAAGESPDACLVVVRRHGADGPGVP